MSSKVNTHKGDESKSPLLASKKKTQKPSKPKRKLVKKFMNDRSRPDESKSPLSTSKKETPKFLKPKGKIVKKSSNENSKLGESSSPLSPAQQTTPKSQKTESKIVNKLSKEDSKSLNPKETQKSPNPVKRPNEKAKHVNTKEIQKGQNPKPEAAKMGLDGNSSKVKEVKSSSTVQPSNEDMKKLGGFIFMCNGKTKRDCYHYRVMGVQAHKKEVMGIKPGMKLFLFDFDLKLLYGIYKASSAGGMKLEPAAFGGGFPLQVRFEVHKDCLPLPESVFKKAFKETYDERTRKFKTELTVGQVKKLANLFKPAPLLNPNPPPVAHEPHRPIEQENMQFPKPTVASPPLLLTEQEYRSYGLRGDRHNNTTPIGPPSYNPYRTDQEREIARPNTLFLSEKDYRTYGLKGRENPTSITQNIETANPAFGFHQPDPYGSYNQNPSSVDRYLSQPPAGPTSFYGYDPLENNSQFHQETGLPDRGERLYSVNATDALSEYNQTAHQSGGELEYKSAPVSSRYAFAGPSVTFR